MLFNSLHFLIFFPIVTIGYFVLPFKYRWFWLLAASCYFYMCFIPIYILILLFTITVDYVSGLWLERVEGPAKRAVLACSIIANLSVLAFFKYFNFFNANFAALADFIGWNYSLFTLKIILPIGLSFHTFQSLSYTIEVYRGRQKAERHFGIFALYVMFYPQLVAGPIERPQNLLHQFHEPHAFDYERIRSGLTLIGWGFFKKLVIADRVAVLVDQVFNHPTEFTGVALMLAVFFFSIQIYCDFAGYSDIARGCARVMGFSLMENFKAPYLAESIADFWRRWHVSLSTWFRDYLYIPLGGSRVSEARWIFNILITFVLSGLWHGANWTFVVWGALHGSLVAAFYLTENARARAEGALGLNQFPLTLKTMRIALTFLCASVAWIFFRAADFTSAWYVLTHLFSDLSTPASAFVSRLGLLAVDWWVAVISIAVLFIADALQRTLNLEEVIFRQPAPIRWGAYSALVFAIVVFGVFREMQFIYFQF